MRTVRIKIKHIIVFIAAILVCFYILIPAGVFVYGSYMESKNYEKAGTIYRKYVDIFSHGIGRDEALYKAASSIFPMSGTLVKVNPGSMGGGQFVDNSMVDKSERYYKEIIKDYKKSEFYSKAYDSLCYIYSITGKTSEAEKLINDGMNSNNNKIKLIASKYKMVYFLIGNKTNDAAALCEKLVKDGSDDRGLYALLGKIYFSAKDYDKAIECYNKAAKILQYYPKDEDEGVRELYFAHEYSFDYLAKYVSMVKANSNNNSKIHGRILADGKPVPFAYVYLRDEKDGKLDTIGGESRGIYAVTDFNGYYSLSNITEGNYELGAGISSFNAAALVYEKPEFGYFHLSTGENIEYNFNFVQPLKITKGNGEIIPDNGKVSLEWEPVNGADYYTVHCVEFETPGKYQGSASSFSISDSITDNKCSIDIEEANSKERGFMSGDDGIVNPQAYLGVFYPGCSVPIYIEAFDKEGKRLTSSVPLRAEYDKTPVVKISKAGITEGDRLILENKPKEAIESYEKELVKDPNNIRILNILSRIYKIGTYVKFMPEKEERKDRDLDKAIELTERLYKITGNYEYKKRIAGIYFWDKKDYKKSLEEYSGIPEAMMDADDFDSAARLELLLLNFKKANEYYDRAYSMNKGINYYGLKPVVLKMYNRDFEGALKFLAIIDMSIYHVDKERLKYDIEKIKGINAGNSDYENFQRALKIELTSNNSKDLQNGFTEIHGRIDDPILTEFLEQVAHYEYIIY